MYIEKFDLFGFSGLTFKPQKIQTASILKGKYTDKNLR